MLAPVNAGSTVWLATPCRWKMIPHSRTVQGDCEQHGGEPTCPTADASSSVIRPRYRLAGRAGGFHGSPSAKHDADPDIQIHHYNPHTVILRQNKAIDYEAPFIFLFFGSDRAFLRQRRGDPRRRRRCRRPRAGARGRSAGRAGRTCSRRRRRRAGASSRPSCRRARRPRRRPPAGWSPRRPRRSGRCWPSEIATSPVPGRQVEEQHVEVAPVDVGEHLHQRPVEHRAAPGDDLVAARLEHPDARSPRRRDGGRHRHDHVLDLGRAGRRRCRAWPGPSGRRCRRRRCRP